MGVDHRRRVVAFAVVAAFLVGTGWITVRALRPEPLPIGGPLPALPILTDSGVETLTAPAGGPLLVIFFHSECSYCLAEFDELEARLDELGQAVVVLLTAEDSLPGRLASERWPRLAEASRIRWARVDADAFGSRFGTLLTPANYVFDARGTLVWKSVGKPRWERLTAALRDALAGGGR